MLVDGSELWIASAKGLFLFRSGELKDIAAGVNGRSFAHHAEVASLTYPEQEEWLDRAEDNGWSRNELRAELRRHSRAREPAVEEQLQLTVASDQLARWRTTAEAEGLDLTDWIHSVADEAARPSESAVRAA